MLSKEILAPHLGGFNIIGCAVRNKDIVYFLAREDYQQAERFQGQADAPDELDLEKRAVSYFRDEMPAKAFGHTALHDFDLPWCAVSLAPKEQFVCITLDGLPFAIGSGDAGIEDELAARGALTRIRLVGEHAYAVGTRRVVYRRDGKNQWHNFSNAIPLAKRDEALGFHDIAGFSAQDIYAVGGAGDVWQFDGSRWRQCAFPSNRLLSTVCCGDDGQVYISGQLGSTYMGRNDSWKQINDETLSLPFKDMVWFQDRVWCTSDYGLWWIKDGQLSEADVSAEIKVCAGYLSARDGVLLLAGYGGAAVLDAQGWRVLFHA